MSDVTVLIVPNYCAIALRLAAVLLGCALDLLLGDPGWMPHPIRGIGALIGGLERCLRRRFPRSPVGERVAGVLLVVLTETITVGGALLLLWGCGTIHWALAFGAESVLCWLCLAARSLRGESMRVYWALKKGTLEEARWAVARIVGRDADRLDEAGVTRAAVETVAENASDGVIAPLLFLVLGGAPLGLFYKACNTMDSMVGSQNERYRQFGWAAARWDDVLNFLPARLSGLLMCLAAPVVGGRWSRTFHIFFRDRRKHKSPNSAHTEAACAGALGIQLAGSGYYFGKLVEKPTIGDPDRPVEPEDIPRANRLMLTAAGLAVLLCCGIPLLWLLA